MIYLAIVVGILIGIPVGALLIVKFYDWAMRDIIGRMFGWK